MEQQSFMVVFQGELVDGFELEQAKENLRELFKVSQEKIEQLFSLPAVVVKKDLTHGLAQQFQTQLQKRGLVTVIQPMSDSKVVQVPEDQMGEAGAGDSAGDDTAAPAVAGAEGKPMPFRFEGNGGEYFKIWIVNVLLSIVTLGIYSAWAKVRNHRYFYSNTHIGEHSFEYLADPITILKGRIVAAVFLAGYILSGNFMPMLQIAFMLVFIVALPWLVCKSMSFRNRNTAFRNIRFGFDGTYGGAFKAFVLWPFLGALSIGLLMPYAIFRQKQFIVEHSRYGTTAFEPAFQPGKFYEIFLAAFGLMLVAIFAGIIPVIGPLFTLGLYLFVFAFVTVRTINLIYNQSTLQAHGFNSRLEVGRLAWIYLSNWFLTAITLGLALPWAKVRLANYHAECLTLMANGSIDEFVAAEEKSVSSLGEEIGDAFDMDIGL